MTAEMKINLSQKLLKIQSELKAPKGQYNSFGHYNYRNCEDILEALKPLLKETKTVLILQDEVVDIGNRFYVKAEALLLDAEEKIDVEEVGSSFKATAFAREEESKKGMDGCQITGAASSYARKYALNGLFAIDDSKDADGDKTGQPPVKPSSVNPALGPFDDMQSSTPIQAQAPVKAFVKTETTKQKYFVDMIGVTKSEKCVKITCKQTGTHNDIKGTIFRTLGKSGKTNPLYDQVNKNYETKQATIEGFYLESKNPAYPDPSFIITKIDPGHIKDEGIADDVPPNLDSKVEDIPF